jgi:hypothetical protein
MELYEDREWKRCESVGREVGSHSKIFLDTAPRPTHMENMTVSNLIDMNDRQWDRPLISSIFLPIDAAAILSIPLSLFLPKARPATMEVHQERSVHGPECLSPLQAQIKG